MAANASTLLQAGPPPHVRTALSRRALEVAVLAGLAPTVIAAVVVHGWAALARLALAAGAAVLVEWLTQRAMRQPVRVGDLTAVTQGLLLALLLPPTVPGWMLVVGATFAISVAKHFYGGVGSYPFNPVLIGWAVLLLSWGNRVHPVGDALLGTAWTPSVAIGGATLVVLGHLDWEAPVGAILGVVLAALAFGATGADVAPWPEQLTTGSVLLGAFFLATDRTCSPANRWPRLLFGAFAGAMVVVLRRYGIWPEPVPFAILLANLVAPLLDRLRPAARRRLVRHG
jgi:electron transport complex protein RnfD